MRLLCDILHLQSHKVISTAITPDLLDSIATLVDKYDFARAIHPWPQIWLQLTHIQDQVTQSDRVSDQHLLKWTHICCHLGYSTYFEKITSELVARVCLDDFDDYLFDDSFAKLPAQIQGKSRSFRFPPRRVDLLKPVQYRPYSHQATTMRRQNSTSLHRFGHRIGRKSILLGYQVFPTHSQAGGIQLCVHSSRKCHSCVEGLIWPQMEVPERLVWECQ